MDLPLAFRIKSPSQPSPPENVSITAILNAHDATHVAAPEDRRSSSERDQSLPKESSVPSEILKHNSMLEQIDYNENEYKRYVVDKYFSEELLQAVTHSDPISQEDDVSKQDIRNRIDDLNTQIKLMRDELDKIEAKLPPRRRPRLLDFDPMQRRSEVMEELKVARKVLHEWIEDVELEWKLLSRRLMTFGRRPTA